MDCGSSREKHSMGTNDEMERCQDQEGCHGIMETVRSTKEKDGMMKKRKMGIKECVRDLETRAAWTQDINPKARKNLLAFFKKEMKNGTNT